MAKFECNVISYTLKRTVDITVIIPSVTIPEAMQIEMPGVRKLKSRHIRFRKNIRYFIYCMDMEITMHNGVAIPVWNCLQKKEILR